MNLRELEYFYETAQTQNISRTAEKFLVPASAVSTAIKKLEKELGTMLFDRKSNRIFLNADGEIFFERVAAARDALQSGIELVKDGKKRPIKVLCRARSKWITELIIEYKRTHDTDFIVSSENEDARGYDVVIDEDSPQYKGWKRFLLSREEICIKAAAKSGLAERKMTFGQLNRIGFILYGEGSGMRNLYKETCLAEGCGENIVVECGDRMCLLEYVKAGMGLTLGSVRSLEEKEQAELVKLDVTDFCPVQSVYVFSTKENRDTAAFCSFLFSKRKI